jgi:hypothetical protein
MRDLMRQQHCCAGSRMLFLWAGCSLRFLNGMIAYDLKDEYCRSSVVSELQL